MELVVDTSRPRQVEVGATGLRQIAQEIRTLLATRKGSVPLDRDFGVSWDMIDRSIPNARQLYVAEVAVQLHKYVPRVRLKSIAFPDPGTDQTQDGIMHASITVEIRDEYLADIQ